MIPAYVVFVLLSSPIECTPAEVAAYEAQGYDAYECDGDKAAALELEAETCTAENGCASLGYESLADELK